MSPTDPPTDHTRGRRDFSLTVLKLSRLLGGGLVSLAAICHVSPAVMSDWVFGARVPDPEAWEKLLTIAIRESVRFSHFAQAYVIDGQFKARRDSGFLARVVAPDSQSAPKSETK